MTKSSEQPSKIKPAKPDAGGNHDDYGPKLPWRWIVPMVAGIAIATTFYLYRQHNKVEQARTELLQKHNALEPLAATLESLTESIHTLSGKVIDTPAKNFVAKNFEFMNLAKQPGIFLRMEPTVSKDIHKEALRMKSETLPSCLGLEATKASVLYNQSTFLTKEWIERGKDTSNMIRLRVMENELRLRKEKDLPIVKQALRSAWFLLLIDRIASSKVADVYIWDLTNQTLLLSLRTEPDGLLVPVRVALPNTPRTSNKTIQPRSQAALDCAIAADIRELTGTNMAEFESEMPQSNPSPQTAESGSEKTDSEASAVNE